MEKKITKLNKFIPHDLEIQTASFLTLRKEIVCRTHYIPSYNEYFILFFKKE